MKKMEDTGPPDIAFVYPLNEAAQIGRTLYIPHTGGSYVVYVEPWLQTFQSLHEEKITPVYITNSGMKGAEEAIQKVHGNVKTTHKNELKEAIKIIETMATKLMEGKPCTHKYSNPSYICNHMGKAVYEATQLIKQELIKNEMLETNDPGIYGLKKHTFDIADTLPIEDAKREAIAVLNMLKHRTDE